MTSGAKAQELTRELGDMLAPGQGWKRQISAVHRELVSDKLTAPLLGLKWSRVKRWFYGEARRADYEEIEALKELKAHEEARRAHREFIQTTTRLAATLAQEGAALSRKQMEVLERIAGRSVDVSGDPHPAPRDDGREMDLSRICGGAR